MTQRQLSIPGVCWWHFCRDKNTGNTKFCRFGIFGAFYRLFLVYFWAVFRIFWALYHHKSLGLGVFENVGPFRIGFEMLLSAVWAFLICFGWFKNNFGSLFIISCAGWAFPLCFGWFKINFGSFSLSVARVGLFLLVMGQGILKGEVSLYCWPPVWLVWISLFCK